MHATPFPRSGNMLHLYSIKIQYFFYDVIFVDSWRVYGEKILSRTLEMINPPWWSDHNGRYCRGLRSFFRVIWKFDVVMMLRCPSHREITL